ncbi:MAG: hypothetical protein JSV26_10010 [bacterium]|nr:MAG: hypothetical protein JSV26_10010 [bacterium]
MITPMVKATIMGPRRYFTGTLDLIHSIGTVHFDPFPTAGHRIDCLESSSRPREADDIRVQLADLLERVRRLRSSLPPPGTSPTAPAWLFDRNISSSDLKDCLQKADGQISPPFDELLTLRNELAMLSRYERVVAALYPLLQRATEVEKLELMGIILERKREGVIPILDKALERITDSRSVIFTGDMDRENIAAIVAYPPEYDRTVRTLLTRESITDIRLPETYSDKPLATTLRLIIHRRKELPGQISLAEERLSDLSSRWSGCLARIEEIIVERLDEIQTVSYGAQSRHTFFLRGWIPADKVDLLLNGIRSNYHEEITVEVAPAGLKEFSEVPVELRNRPFVRIFEPLIRLLALPRYGTLDPTPFMAFFFPLFFGFILGDIGYGLALLGLSSFLRYRFREIPLVASLASIFMLGGTSAIVFGALFGEFVGDLGEHWGLHPLLMDRSRLFMPLLFIAIGLGVAHILIGFCLSLLIGIRQRHGRHGASATANILALTGAILLVASAIGYVPEASTVGILLLILGLTTLLFTEGLMGPMEFLKTFGNILSYSRLMAIGMSSVVLAKVANMMGGTAGSIAVGVIIALIFHSLNFALGVFSPTIHSLRLHYVEFFSKFYQPGGRPYRPFRRHSTL